MSENGQKRILMVQDLSFVGRCSALTAIPVVSAAGIECCFVPSMLLTTHTGFSGATVQSAVDITKSAAKQYKQLGLRFDAFYTGYLGNGEQLKQTERLIDDLAANGAAVIVDPAFADNGRLYGGYDDEYPALMASFCAKADIIIPNLTEAELMLGVPHRQAYDQAYVKELLMRLCESGAKSAVITGLRFEKDKMAIMGFNGETGDTFCHSNPYAAANFYGTGDLFASVLVSAFVKGNRLEKSAVIAADFTAKCAGDGAANENTDFRFGVRFEHRLRELIDTIG